VTTMWLLLLLPPL